PGKLTLKRIERRHPDPAQFAPGGRALSGPESQPQEIISENRAIHRAEKFRPREGQPSRSVQRAGTAQLSGRDSFIFGPLLTTRLLRRQGKAKAKKTEDDYKRTLNHERIHSGNASSASEILQTAWERTLPDARKMRALPALTIRRFKRFNVAKPTI